MNYHLHHDGKSHGAFPLEELRRSRETGELTGTEYVWSEGMPKWLLLDDVLKENTPASQRATPPPLPALASKKGLRWGLYAAILSGFVGLAVTVIGFGLGLGNLAKRLPTFSPQVGQAGNEGAVELARKAVTWSTNSLTQVQVDKRSREFRVRQWVEGYKQRGNRTAPCDTESLKFIETWLARIYDGDAATNLPPTQTWGDQLASAPGCDDPLLLTAAAANSIELHESISRLERALRGFPLSKHWAYPRLYASVILAGKLSDQRARVPALDAASLQLFKEALADGSFLPGDQAELAEIFVNGWAYDFFYRNRTAIGQILDESGGSFPWLSLVLKGEYHITEAWKARGGGYADTVSDEGWRGFSKHVAQARGALTKAWNLHPELPLASARMIDVALGDSGIEEMRMWFDRAVAAQIDYPKAWASLRWGLRPRWHGDLNSMLAFGVAAVKTRRFDTGVPRKFFDVVADLESEEHMPAGRHIYGRRDIWPHISEMYEGYIAEPSQRPSQDGWRSAYATVAYFGGRYDAARTQLESLDWKPRAHNLTGWGADLSLMPLEVAARTGSGAKEVAKAEAAQKAGDTAMAVQLYGGLISATATDDRTREFARCRTASIKLEQQLHQGEWVDFLPKSDDDPNWVVAWGKPHRLADGSLEVQSGRDGHLLYSRARPGQDFEIKGEFESVRSSSKDFQAGLILGMPDCDAGLETSDWYGFRIKSNAVENQVASFAIGWTKNQIAQRYHFSRAETRFTFAGREVA